jgi:hypothetical protein
MSSSLWRTARAGWVLALNQVGQRKRLAGCNMLSAMIPSAPLNHDRLFSVPAVARLRSTVVESTIVRRIRELVKRATHAWRAFCFGHRFYEQARKSEIAGDASVPVPMEDFTEALFRQSLAARIHALVQLRVAAQVASIQETSFRAAMCRQAGWSEEQIGAAMLGMANGVFSEPEKLVLQYAEDMTRTPSDIDPQVVKQLRSYFSGPELIELTASIAHANFRTRFSDARAKLGC